MKLEPSVGLDGIFRYTPTLFVGSVHVVGGLVVTVCRSAEYDENAFRGIRWDRLALGYSEGTIEEHVACLIEGFQVALTGSFAVPLKCVCRMELGGETVGDLVLGTSVSSFSFAFDFGHVLVSARESVLKEVLCGDSGR